MESLPVGGISLSNEDVLGVNVFRVVCHCPVAGRVTRGPRRVVVGGQLHGPGVGSGPPQQECPNYRFAHHNLAIRHPQGVDN